MTITARQEFTEATINAAKALFMADPTASREAKREMLALLEARPGNADEPKPEKIIGIREAASRLSKTPKTVHLYCKMGLLQKAKFGAQSRASGIFESSLENLLSAPQTIPARKV